MLPSKTNQTRIVCTMSEDLDGLNLSELTDAIAQEEVLIVRFQNFEERLLLDMRLGEDDQPLVRMVGPVSSAEERYTELRQIRPEVALPERIMVVPWPRSFNEMQRLGLWQEISSRIIKVAGDSATQLILDLQTEIERLEVLELAAIIRGDIGYETLWERDG
jgi:hypothetical protein